MIKNNNFKTRLTDSAEDMNRVLSQILSDQFDIDENLYKAMEYILSAKGKRIRSTIVLWCCELLSGSVNHNAKIAAAAIEMVHTYSLIHDDLPAMDNDDMRRGRPTCHKQFDEATAILTGDAFLTLAFEILARHISPKELSADMIVTLAEAAGPAGMIAGQMADLKAENTDPSGELLEYIHTNKTAKMFQAAAILGAIAGSGSDSQIQALSQYGLKIGLSFQIADDILDVSATTLQLGKTAGKDAKAGKLTYPAMMGIEKSKQFEKQLIDEAVSALKDFGDSADSLRQLALMMLERKK